MQHVSHQHASQLFTDTENAKTDTGLMSIRISKYSESEEDVENVCSISPYVLTLIIGSEMCFYC